MKNILNILLILFPFILTAQTYYFDNTGSDSNDGLSEITPWLHPNNHTYTTNDVWLFNRDDVFDTVDIYINGISNVKLGAYGTGELPILSGAVEVNDFVNESGNIYYSVKDSDFPRGTEIYSPNGITINHIRQNCSSIDSISEIDRRNSDINTIRTRFMIFTSNELVGGIISVQPVKWQWNSVYITSNTSNTIELTQNLGYNPISSGQYEEKRYFTLWNLPQYLEDHGEWCFYDDTLRVYSTSNPNDLNVRFTLSDTILHLNNCPNAYIENIVFEQSNHIGILTTSSTDLKIDTCKFNDISGYGIRTFASDADTIINSMFIDILNHSLFLRQGDRHFVQGNYFKRNAILWGLSNYTYGSGGNCGATIKFQDLTTGGDAVFQYNYFDSVALATQFFTATNSTDYRFQYNYIENYGISLADNAAFYAASEVYSSGVYRMIKNNIFKNGIAMGEETFYTIDHNAGDAILPTYRSDNYPHAIYYDEDAILMLSDSNSVLNSSGYALATNIRNRSSFNHGRTLRTGQDMKDPDWNSVIYYNQAIGSSTSSADRDTLYYNHFVIDNGYSNSAYQRHTTSARVALGYDNNLYYFNNNKLAYPFGTSADVGKYNINYGSASEYSLATMQASGGDVSAIATDANTTLEMRNDYSGKSVSKDNYAKMFINYSDEPHTFNLNGTYRDIDSTEVTTSLTVQPFYSEILFWQSGDTTDVTEKFDSTLVYFLTFNETEQPEVGIPVSRSAYRYYDINSNKFYIIIPTVTGNIMKRYDLIKP